MVFIRNFLDFVTYREVQRNVFILCSLMAMYMVTVSVTDYVYLFIYFIAYCLTL
jgi:hypothetical protein